ncbi:exosortase A [Arsukibacterium tuosuense]|uniref:Exosortase A n=1 Tax=Arsukibacterium tuosuense TaxID=1323745 RepID=A0A285IUD3_9GAMM|nr:exosortase A [Arsukibacterium tuosuense]SNY51592.1 exosortase A [Arsukibacterium tuosuense]
MSKVNLPELSKPARSYAMTLTAFIVVWLLCFSETLWSMVAIWLRSDTYAHGILIFPISLYLVWRKRQHIAATPLRPDVKALPLLFALVVVWYFANAVAVNVVSQLAVVLMLPVLVWLCCGWQLLKLLRFPLLYLLFAVPMGDNLVPWLQDITADITVAALQLSQIPVYRDGLYLSTPTGLFLVAEACSGIRYLIASVALGTLYAYLTYTSRVKQLVFCLAAVVVPILANGVRAYGIVLIASLTDMKHAVGVDHLIYGWIFFGLIIFIMFFIGGFFADKQRPQPVASPAAIKPVPLPLLLSGVSVMLIPLLVNLLLPPLAQQPFYSTKQLEQSLTPVTESLALPQFSDSSAQLAGIWQYENREIWFYAAFYQHTDDKKLVSWHNQPYQTASWTPASSQRRKLQIGQQSLALQEVDLRASNGQKRLLWYWYGSGNYFSADPYLITAMQAMGKVFHFSQHGSFYALSVYYEDDPVQAGRILQQTLEQRFSLIAAANSAEPEQVSLAQQVQQP